MLIFYFAALFARRQLISFTDRAQSTYYLLRKEKAAMCDSDVASAQAGQIYAVRQRRGARRRVLPSCTVFNCRAPRLRSTSSGLFRSLFRTRDHPPFSPLRYPLHCPFPRLSLSLSRSLVFFICLRSLVQSTWMRLG